MTARDSIDATEVRVSDAAPLDGSAAVRDPLPGSWVTESWMTWFAGASAATAALATGEVSASLVGAPSPVNAIAALFVTPAPDGFVGWAMTTFGAGQLSVLVWSVVAVVILVGAVLGRTSALATPQIADLGFTLFGLLSVIATLTTTLDAVVAASVASLTAAAVGASVLRVLLARLADIRRTLAAARSRRLDRRSTIDRRSTRGSARGALRTHHSVSRPSS